MFARVATKDDIALVLEIFNTHQLAVAPNAGTNDVEWAEDFIQGFPEPSPAYLLSETEDSPAIAVGNLNPSTNARRYQADISVLPDSDLAGDVVDWFIAKAKEIPDMAFWTTCNSDDVRMNEIYLARGLKVNRYFNTLRKTLNGEDFPELPEGVSIRNIDKDSDQDMKIWHELHKNAFSKHFGFIARPFEQFLEIWRSNDYLKRDGIFVLFVDGQPAGYTTLIDIAHDSTGQVWNLGVAYEYQGKGYGQLLLGWANAVFVKKGYAYAELGVDTANESGALRLYEKMGFELVTSWTQYED